MSNNPSKHALEHILTVVNALTPLLIRTGIGYTEFAAACKPVFYRQAILEAERNGQKKTDSSISLLAGLHRRDTATLRKAMEEDPNLANPPLSQPVSLAKQVVALWLSKKLPDTIAVTGSDNSFSDLVQQVSKDQHFRSILTDLERIGVVTADNHNVTLLRAAFTPNPQEEEAWAILAENVSDHIFACMNNIFADLDKKETGSLEQAIFSDGLSQESIKELQSMSNKLWFDTVGTILERAITLHKHDKKHTDTDESNMQSYRFKLGMYAYHQQEKIPSDIKQ